MKKSIFSKIVILLLLFFSLLNFGQIIDQSNTATGSVSSISPTNSGGQSFTAGQSGTLNSIKINIFSVPVAGAFTFKIYNGAGYSGTEVHSQVVNITAGTSGVYTFNIGNVVNITSGSVYTFRLMSNGVGNINFYLSSVSGSTYANGTFYLNDGTPYTAGDYNFQTFMNTIPGAALNFDGVNDYVSVPVFDFSASNKLTIEAWIKPTNITTNTYYEISRQQGSPDWIFSFQNNGTILSFGLSTSVGGYTELDVPITASSFTDGNWHHVAVVYDGATKRIYKDGVQIGNSENKTGNVSFSSASGTNNIGACCNAAEHFNGSIDEVRFWNRSLSLTELNSNRNCELSGTQTNLFAYYKFNNGIASGANSGLTALNDFSGNNRNGTLVNFGLSGSTSNFLASTPVSPVTTSNFAAIPSFCSGTTAPLLATTSPNGVAGTWSPATISNTASGNYIFTPTSSCNTIQTLSVTVTPTLTSNFATIPTICSGTTAPTLALTSPNGVAGIWSPATISNTASGSYVFTPTSSCNTGQTLSVTVKPSSNNVTTIFACDTYTWSNNNQTYTQSGTYTGSTTNCVTEKLNLTINATPNVPNQSTLDQQNFLGNYSVAGSGPEYQTFTAGFTGNLDKIELLHSNPNGNTAATNLLMKVYSGSGITGTLLGTATFNYPAQLGSQTVSYNFTGISVVQGQQYTFEIVPQSLTVSYLAVDVNGGYSGGNFGPYQQSWDMVFKTYVSENANQSFCNAATVGNLTATGTNLKWYDVPTGGTALLSSAFLSTNNYYVSQTSNACESARATVAVTINPLVTPTFTAVAPICSGATLSALPTTSNNSITGTWSPTLNNSATTTYTFTPTAGLCATTSTLTIAVNPNITPTFTAVAPICSGAALSALPTTSNNNITGTWSPTLNNAATTTYTFTPTVGQCATNATLTINVTPSSTNVRTVSTCDSFWWGTTASGPGNGVTYTTSGTYTGVTNNCVTQILNLTIAPSTNQNYSETACSSYTWSINNETYTNTGFYAAVIGCVTHQLALTIGTEKPTGLATQVYSGAGTLASLSATGSNIQFYANATGGTVLQNTTLLSDGTTYYASQTISGCESAVRLPIKAVKISENTQNFCGTATVNNLIATPSVGASAKWFTSASGGTALANSSAITTGTYYVEQQTLASETRTNLGSGFTTVSGLSVDNAGTIYFSDFNSVKKMDASGNNIQILGSGFNSPRGLTVDPSGNIFVADCYNHIIKKMDNNGGNIQSVGIGANFSYPSDVKLDAMGNIYMTDYFNVNVKKLNPAFGNLQILGSGLNYPHALALDTEGKIYVASTPTAADVLSIKKMDGFGQNFQSFNAGTNAIARVIAFDSNSKVYFGDNNSQSIKKMDKDGTNLTTVFTGFGNNINFQAIAFDKQGSLYIGQNIASYIIKIAFSVAITSNRVAVQVTVGSAEINNTTISECGAYTWATNGQTYTQSGNYSSVNGCATENLALTITSITSTTTTITNAGSYFWSVNGTTYNQSGTYTYLKGCDTQILDVTIIPNLTFYADSDADGFGNPNQSILAVTMPQGYVTNATDCDDTNPNVNPNKPEIAYNGIDDNCDGNLDEGFTKLITSMPTAQCGQTLVNIWDSVYTTLVQNSTAYRYRVRNMTTNAVQYLVKAGITRQWFAFNTLASYDYSTTYTVDVELQVNGIWLGYYGNACTINTTGFSPVSNIGPSNLNTATCEKTQTELADVITAINISGATGYRYEVTNQNTGIQLGVIDRNLPWFNMTMFPTAPVYGTAYTVRVAIKTTGTYGAYGSPCTIYTPIARGLNAATCGLVATAKWNPFTTFSRNKVTMYRYQITNSVTSQVQILDRASNWFNITMLPSGYTPNTVYSVQVAYSTSPITGTLVFSPFSSACNITAPSMARSAFAPEDPTEIIDNEFKVNAMPNPFSYNFGLDLKSSFDSIIEIKVYNMIGKLLEIKEISYKEINNLSLGENYPSGVYNVIVSQDNNIKTLRVIKR